jgi:hypothetical protein
VSLGDVVEESDGDLMGDGVNIAAKAPLLFWQRKFSRKRHDEIDNYLSHIGVSHRDECAE